MRSTAKVDPTFGTAIRHARTERRMTQEALAFAAGLSVATLGHIERAENGANLATAEAIAGALGVPLHKMIPSRPPRPRRDRPARPGVNPAVAATVRRLREDCGLSQQGLAEEAYLSLETIARLERGGVIPRMDTMQAIADGLGVRLQELIESIAQTRAGEQDGGDSHRADAG
jgi:transcriptional regulator with XRE-family HTH domain